MQYRHLYYFVKIVEAGSFSQAARTIHVAQPALSHQIAELEASLGMALLKRSAETDPTAGQWTYLAGSLQVDADGHAVRLADLSAVTDNEGVEELVAPIVNRLRDNMSVDYGVAHDNLLNAANARLNRTLKDGYRMEGHLSSAKLEKLYLPADGVVIALRASGELKILYGM